MNGWFQRMALIVGCSGLATNLHAQLLYELGPIPLNDPGMAPFVEGLTLTGSIMTDGSTGVLDQDSVLSYQFTVEGPNGATFTGPVGALSGVSFVASERALRLGSIYDVESFVCAGGACDVSIAALQTTGAGPNQTTIGYGFLGEAASIVDFAVFANSPWINAAAVIGNDQPFAVNAAIVSGDYNDDGIVNEADAAVWIAAYGSEVLPGESADGNWDGVINAADYTVWRDSLLMPAVPIPEPGATALIIAACLAMWCRR